MKSSQNMTTPADNNHSIKDQVSQLITHTICYVWAIGFAVMCVMPIYQQIKSWLKTGQLPKRDLYWFLANTSCEATNWEANGFNGMDLCRPDHIEFTNWVGVNNIINWIFGLHIGIIFIAVSCIAIFIITQIINNTQTTKPNMEL